MKTASLVPSSVRSSFPSSAKLKIVLLVLAFAIIGSILWYTHTIVQSLSKKEKEIADLYAKSLEYIANARANDIDYSFVFTEIINSIDFPIIMTDAQNRPIYPFQNNVKNIEIDTTLPKDRQLQYLNTLIHEMDAQHPPIKVAYQDTIILNYVHYSESFLITRLRWLPYVELAIVGLFIFIGYISFSYIKRSEQSNIWVGMARETAHQLGTPISSMLGWVELLKDQLSHDPKTTETLHDMENDLHRLQKIADRFSKIGSKADLHDENLRDILGKVIEYFKRRIPQTGKKVHIVIDSSTPVRVPVNRELFEWVIENLTKNALDAIENGEGTIAYSISEQGNQVFIDVSDTGKGIDIKHRNDVFRPGFSTKKRGWGLGLSLSKRIIESYHHGKLSLKESKSGYKTTFRIRLKK
jgi:two-component sensor histidine kinase